MEYLPIRQCQQIAPAFAVLNQRQVAYLKQISIDGQRFNPVSKSMVKLLVSCRTADYCTPFPQS
tara:strand:- start:45 stop:236 length:192 start_codon:yes stop_codon:yes gene_type:complete